MNAGSLNRLIAMLRRVPAHAAVAGGWAALFQSVSKVLREEGSRAIWRKATRFLGAVPRSKNGKSDGARFTLEGLRPFANKLERKSVRLIAFYLPQYHPIPENDAWWGKGFTEWTNVAKAKPNFAGHYQPHLPGELGFYDLRLPEVRQKQADLAAEYGIHGFCYYYYWFNGRRLLNRPLDEVVVSGQPLLPFCVCWANENWTRTWDGRDNQVLIAQQYSPANDDLFIRSLFPALANSRYIRINGKPLILIYKASLLPDPLRTTELWRTICRQAGIGDIYLACVLNLTNGSLAPDPRSFGFDAGVEFPPLGGGVPIVPTARTSPGFNGIFYDYWETAKNFMSVNTPAFPWFRGVMPSWDNTARRQDAAHIFLHSSPKIYQRWLDFLMEWTVRERTGDERIIFINAWNEWAEGNHLEPDQEFGRAYLEATHAVCEAVIPPEN
jgi:lipopolysaccharide biosynthesis protein